MAWLHAGTWIQVTDIYMKYFFLPDCESPWEELEGLLKVVKLCTLRLAIINKNCILWALSVDHCGWNADKELPKTQTRPTNEFHMGYKTTAVNITTK